MIFELRSLDDTGHIIASEPIEGEEAAWATFRNCEEHARKNGGCFELLKGGVRAAYFYQEKPER